MFYAFLLEEYIFYVLSSKSKNRTNYQTKLKIVLNENKNYFCLLINLLREKVYIICTSISYLSDVSFMRMGVD